MATGDRALYRIQGGEVMKVSVPGNKPAQEFADRNQTYWGVAVDPLTPDGTHVIDPADTNRTRRVLGFAKFYESGSNTIRNATQPEIDAWAAAETDDENQQDADQAKDLLNTHPRMRKVLVALSEIIMDEINVLRAIASLPARTLSQLKTLMTNRINKDD
jgi:hypothetical protein